MLPTLKEVKQIENNFPTTWQTVIFRNYGMVKTKLIAKVLSCQEKVVKIEAKRLGLKKIKYNADWQKKGYITIIRNNWYLLSFSQLCTILNFTKQKLEFVLQNEDFLGYKLGDFKPIVQEIKYSPLTKEEIEKTDKIRLEVEKYLLSKSTAPFKFFKKGFSKGVAFATKTTKMVHGYLTPCGDVFSIDSKNYMPTALLKEYAKKGINAVWVHGLLSSLSHYPFCPELCVGYENRRKKLQKLVDKCGKYGIKVYLYFNEPRALPIDKSKNYSHLIGREENGVAHLCFEHKEVQDYLYSAVKDLFSNVKGLGGCFTITMSENPTHCHYRPNNNCPVCANVNPEEVTAKINNVILKGVKDSGAKAEVIANLWGWSSFMGWSIEQAERGIKLLDKEISVLCVSEFDLDIEKGGIKSKVIDYSISNPGPAEISKRLLSLAKKEGHKTYAKIQINNSWECSAVPYLPVFDLTLEHIKNLTEIGVENYLLNWTLGGYPSPVMDMIATYSSLKNNFSIKGWYKNYFKENAEIVKNAVDYFCNAFREYPFSIDNLYYAPKTLGYANLWEKEKSEKQTTMVCYAFDDYFSWIKPYPYKVYVGQYEKLLSLWEKGLELLKTAEKTKTIKELALFAKAAYCHFYSDLLQTEYCFYKEQGDKENIKIVVKKCESLTKELIQIVKKSPYVGFETSNHYFYTERNLIEKLINLKRINN